MDQDVEKERAEGYEDAEEFFVLLERLATVRRTRGLTQRDVASAMETSQSAISELENGDSDPRISTVQRYARALGARVTFAVSAY